MAIYIIAVADFFVRFAKARLINLTKVATGKL